MSRSPIHILLAVILFVTSGTAAAQTVTVTTSADIVDIDWTSATVADLPGPDGLVSFSEAMIATNNTPGHQTVGFAIPESDWILQFVHPGRAVLTTQTAFTGDTNPDGWEVAIYGDELYLNGDNSTFIGFDSTAVSLTGSNGLIQGNTGTMNITVYGGSGSRIEGNEGGTIKIDRSRDNVVVGNTVQRVRVQGGGPTARNNRIGGPAPADRNFLTGYGTWNSEGLPAGTTVQLFETEGTLVENNSIGTTPDGLAQGSLASTIGIGFEGENHDAVIRNNRIAGILGHGQGPHHAGQLFGWAVLIGGSGSGITFTGNTVGLDALGEPTLGSVHGIDIGNSRASTVRDIRIGGTAPGEGNVVAGHIFSGVTVGHNVPQARISGNSIHDNGDLAIDLVPTGYGYGVSPNDPQDADTGGNGVQNFPVLASATREGAMLRVAGTLHSTPSNDFTLELFASPECDPTGHGEGELFLGSTVVTTDGSGDASFSEVLDASPADGWAVTATATLEPLGATSELSACVTVDGGCTPYFRDEDRDDYGTDDSLCLPGPAYPHRALVSGDCDDADPAVHPGLQGLDCQEPQDGIDNDCDGEVDEETCPGCFISAAQ